MTQPNNAENREPTVSDAFTRDHLRDMKDPEYAEAYRKAELELADAPTWQQAHDLLGRAVLLHIANASQADWERFGKDYAAYAARCPSRPDDLDELCRKLGAKP